MSKENLCRVSDDPSYDYSDYIENEGYYKVTRKDPSLAEPENRPARMTLNKTLEPLITDFGATSSVDENGTIHLDWTNL